MCINRAGGFRCDCSPGYTFDSSRSICLQDGLPPSDILCPLGSRLNREGTGCIPTGPGARENCPSGYTLRMNPDGSPYCIRSGDRCPNGYHLSADGLSCVPLIFVNCSAGHFVQNGVCVELDVEECPPGYMLLSDGVSCRNPNMLVVCPVGYRLSRNGRMCTSSQICAPGIARDARGQCRVFRTGECPEGFILLSDQVTCVHSTGGHIFCPYGYVLSSDRTSCTLPSTGGCPLGYHLQAGRCIPFPPGDCPDGYTLQPDGFTCINGSGSIFCPQGFALSQDGDACISVKSPFQTPDLGE